jgi:two-component system phosphate regulon sensor histidine kinase PhoR
VRRPSFRAQLVVGFVGLVVAAEAVTLSVLDRALGDDLVAQLDARLVTQAEGAAAWISQRRADRGGGDPSYDRHAGRLARVIGAWVTVIDEGGEVQGDSEIEDEDERVAEVTRAPEVLAARRGQLGRDTRWSPHHAAMIYFVAAPASTGAIVRLGVPLSAIEATRANTRARLLVAAIIASVVALLLGLLVAQRVARPVRAMTDAAERIARGDYAVVLDDPSPDELGTLARTLSSLAAQLSARIGELVHERDRLSAILSGMVEGVLVTDTRGTVVLANPSAARLLGVAAEGRPLQEVLGEAAARVASGANTGVTSSTPGASVGLAPSEVTRGERTLAVTVERLRGVGEGGVVVVLHDVTERQRLEAMRRDFVAQISHELRTPVAAIQGYAETLLSGRPDEPTRAEFLEVIHRQARRMGRLVADLLRLAELEARPAAQVREERVELARVTAHVLETVRDRAAEAGVTITADVPAGVAARSDPDDLEQVLENLVDNAVRYGARPGQVRIIARAADGRVRLTVEDDGAGIPSEDLTRVFDRFYRVDPARSRKLGGTGLGLAIVQRLVTALRGTVRAEGEPGRGARFVVELPADVAPE